MSIFINEENKQYIVEDQSENYAILKVDCYTDLCEIVIRENLDLDVIYIHNKNIYFCEFENIYVAELDNNLLNIAELLKKNDIYIFNDKFGWFFINLKKNLLVNFQDKTINCLKCIPFKDFNQNELLFENIKKEFQFSKECIKLKILNANCKNSMDILDSLHRNKLQEFNITNNIIAIKAVAGGGKTTMLLRLAKKFRKEIILYTAFNKDLIQEIENKKKKYNIKSIFPRTFDSLMLKIFKTKADLTEDFEIDHKLKNNLSFYIREFNDKPYKYSNVKSSILKKLSEFCNQVIYDNIEEYVNNNKDSFKNKSEKWIYIYKKLWELMLNYTIITFDSIRKIVQINNWANGYIDKIYDKIFIDEAQDFDNVMLHILLNNTTIPKIFVGDPLQAIYQFRGSINTFDLLPKDSLLIELYSTFRIGEPACSEICTFFDNCNMISKSKNKTIIEYSKIPDEIYTYLFRSWKSLLLAAKNTRNIYINNYENKIDDIKKQHENLIKFPNKKFSDEDANSFEDDLPQFLIKLSLEELTDLINSIENNLVDKENADVIFTTIHSYKGLETDIIRISDDIKIESEQTLYYVALTRGMKKIILDKNYGKVDSNIKIDTRKTESNDYIKLLIEGKSFEEIAELNNTSLDELLLLEEVNTINIDLIDKLKQYRTMKAKQLKLSPCFIFSNEIIKLLILNNPSNKKELLQIKGFGPKMYEKFGPEILDLLKI